MRLCLHTHSWRPDIPVRLVCCIFAHLEKQLLMSFLIISSLSKFFQWHIWIFNPVLPPDKIDQDDSDRECCCFHCTRVNNRQHFYTINIKINITIQKMGKKKETGNSIINIHNLLSNKWRVFKKFHPLNTQNAMFCWKKTEGNAENKMKNWEMMKNENGNWKLEKLLFPSLLCQWMAEGVLAVGNIITTWIELNIHFVSFVGVFL